MNKNEVNAKVHYILRSLCASKEQKNQLADVLSEVVDTAQAGVDEPNVDEIKSDVATLQTDTEQIKSDVTDINTALSDTNTALTATNTNVENVTTQVTDLTTQVTDLTTQASSLTTQLSETNTQLSETNTSVSSIKEVTDTIVNLGVFTSSTDAWTAAAQQALNYDTVHTILYDVKVSDNTAFDGYVDQHYYIDNNSTTLYVYQFMHNEGYTDKQYIRTITINNGAISDIGSWTDYKLAASVSSLSDDATLADVISTVNSIIENLKSAKLMKS